MPLTFDPNVSESLRLRNDRAEIFVLVLNEWKETPFPFRRIVRKENPATMGGVDIP